ncbi:MAG: site-specific DNA-methyltransferase [Oscillospiraceae bacterium]|nr:site-specific DNA-methyltransferase [Oscillospiraceae bacterium]
MAKIATVQEVDVSALKPYANNAKLHGDEQVKKICDSIREFGFISPCLIDSEYNVIAGHGRIMAAKKMGLDRVPCLFVEGLSDEQRKAYILADNRLTELGEWDMDLVSEELRALSDAGFSIEVTGFELDDQIIDTSPIDDCGIGGQIDEMIEAKEPTSKRGDIWQLGDHRLMCGDSTVLTDVERLMGGEQADLMVTDPPYNVAIQNSSGMTIQNDDMKDDEFCSLLRDALSNAWIVMRPGAAFYIWHADGAAGLQFREAVRDARLTLKENIIWVKNHFTLGRQDYQWRHEPCLYGWKEGATHYFQSARNLSTIMADRELEGMSKDELLALVKDLVGDSTVWNEHKPLADDLHPTMKPVSLIERQIKNSSKKGWNVIDLFGGSGTTLIACEGLGRKCFMMELDPHYVDVIVDRWEKLTGKKAVLLNDAE